MEIKKVFVLEVRSAAHVKAFCIKQGVLFLHVSKWFRRVQRRARAITRLICRSLSEKTCQSWLHFENETRVHEKEKWQNEPRDNVRAPIQFRRERQFQHLSSSVTRPVKRNKLSFSSIEINRPLPAADEIKVQQPYLVVATDQMPDLT